MREANGEAAVTLIFGAFPATAVCVALLFGVGPYSSWRLSYWFYAGFAGTAGLYLAAHRSNLLIGILLSANLVAAVPVLVRMAAISLSANRRLSTSPEVLALFVLLPWIVAVTIHRLLRLNWLRLLVVGISPLAVGIAACLSTPQGGSSWQAEMHMDVALGSYASAAFLVLAAALKVATRRRSASADCMPVAPTEAGAQARSAE